MHILSRYRIVKIGDTPDRFGVESWSLSDGWKLYQLCYNNLQRFAIFPTKEEALEFVEKCKDGRVKDGREIIYED